MDISMELLEKEKMDFLNLKMQIKEELGFDGTDDEIEETLEKFLSLESEIFNISLNDIVLKRYYEYFLENVYPTVMDFIEINNNSDKADTSLLLSKNKINRKNKKAIEFALKDYFCTINNDYLLNQLNSHEVLISSELRQVVSNSDIFQKNNHLNKSITGNYPSIKYNYNYSFWKNYSNIVSKVIESLNKRLESKIPDFEESLNSYEYHIGLYKEFVKKYRYISICDMKGEVKCQK